MTKTTPLASLLNKEELTKLCKALIGATFYSASINIFIAPANFYNGGFMGFSQLIQYFLIDFLKLPLGSFNLSGLIYYLLNIPILFVAYKIVGRKFFVKTLICVTWIMLAMSIIPIPASPLLDDDLLGTCFIGGLLAGYGIGTMLKMGASGGGMDIIGLALIKLHKKVSVGQLSLAMNVVLYAICLMLFDIRIVIYSLIYAAISSFAVDRVHDQTITVEATVITKKDSKEMNDEIFQELRRGITIWEATGAYTNQETKVLYVLLSKYEVRHLKHIVKKYDPNAFIVVNEGVHIQGNYQINL